MNINSGYAFYKYAQSFLCLLCFLPFVLPYHALPLTSFHSEFLAIILGLAAIFCVSFVALESVPFIFLTLIPFTLMLLFYSSTAFLYMLWAICIGYTAYVCSFRIKTKLAIFILLGGILNAIFGMLSQENNIANYVMLAFISTVYLIDKDYIKMKYGVSLLLAFTIFLLMSPSRSASLYLLLFCVYLLWDEIRDKRILSIGMLVFSVVFLGLLNTSDSLRIAMFLHALQNFIDHWILGIGFGQYLYVVNEAEYSAHSHNLILQIAAETGFIGLVLLAIPILFWFESIEIKWYTASILLIIAMHSMLEFPLWYANFLGLFFIFASLPLVRYNTIHIPHIGIILRILSVLGFCFAGYFYYYYTAMGQLPAFPVKTEIIEIGTLKE